MCTDKCLFWGHSKHPIASNRMKKAAFLLTSLLISSTCLTAQWRTTYSGTDSVDQWVSASFYSASAGYMVTSKWLGFTTDSGHTFQQSTISNINLALA